MTTRHIGYLVTLEREVRADDDEEIITALKMVRGVVDVRPVEADISSAHCERIAARCEVQKAVYAALDDALWPEQKR